VGDSVVGDSVDSCYGTDRTIETIKEGVDDADDGCNNGDDDHNKFVSALFGRLPLPLSGPLLQEGTTSRSTARVGWDVRCVNA